MTVGALEAVDAAKDAPVSDLLASFDAHIAARGSGRRRRRRVAGAVADAIDRSPASTTGTWQRSTTLREHAGAAAAVLRRIAESGPADRED